MSELNNLARTASNPGMITGRQARRFGPAPVRNDGVSSTAELVARINAVLRRRISAVPGAPAEVPEIVRFGDCVLDLGMRTLTRGGEEHALTTGEFALLKALVSHPRQPLSRDHLSEMARGREYEVFDRAIDVQVSRLRKLIEEDPAKPRHIQTVRGFGYVFVPGVDSAE